MNSYLQRRRSVYPSRTLCSRHKSTGHVTYNNQAKVYRHQKKLLFTVDNTSRVVPHPFAEFVVLESKGDPISILRPVDTTGKTPEEIEREKESKKVEARFPKWMDKTYTPNEIHVVDLSQNKRYRIPFSLEKTLNGIRIRAIIVL